MNDEAQFLTDNLSINLYLTFIYSSNINLIALNITAFEDYLINEGKI